MKKITAIHAGRPSVQRKTRVAAYCRVSTASDEQLVSLDAQKEHYDTYIGARSDWEFAGLYYDEGITGTKKDKRGGLQTMLSDCEDGRIDLIITKSVSRFARNTADCLEMVRKLTSLGVYIYFEKENIYTKNMESELMLSILAGIAESEAASVSTNTKWSVRKRYERGTFEINTPPYGYAREDGQMVIVPEQAEVVRRIYESCLAGNGTQAIAKMLNEEGIKSMRGGKWSAASVGGILTNEKYTGDAIFQKTYTDGSFRRHVNYGEKDRFLCEGHHEAIVSREDFDRVRELLDFRAAEKGNGPNKVRCRNRYALSGRIRCGCCGGSFKRRQHYKPSGNYVAWTCTTHLENKDACPMLYIEEEAVKTAFMTMMNKLVFGHQQILKPLMRGLRAMDDQERLTQIGGLEQRIEANASMRQKLETFMAQGLLDAPFYNEEKSRLQQEAEELQNERERLVCDVGGGRDRIRELRTLMDFTSGGRMLTQFEDDLFTAAVDSITVLSREQITFHLKCGLDLTERLVK